ncbi:MAG: NAD-dependent epimerase/dehydratase family protein [Candidatus Lindowbacteria bacterium]|nr:NAD-dependent epimerase/dehydratase family protein [Candidatus Lindowbacteria bacterium]
MSDEKVIVFGGSGFIGSHIADALTNSGYKVSIFDKVKSPFLRDDQIMIEGDIMDRAAVNDAVKDSKYVYNFAGLADLDAARNKPVEAATLNVVGNVHVLDAAAAANVDRFIYASTVYVYSESGSFYRASKQSAEHFVESYHERYDLNYTILRYGSLYGPRSDRSNNIYLLLKEALEEKTISYKGDGEALRDYIHVEDAARLSVKILDEEFANRHMILTGQERFKMKDLMQMIAEIVAKQAGPVELKFGANQVPGHYLMTPYSFNPKPGHKLVSNDYVDMGQGLIECLSEIVGELEKSE